MMEEGKGLRMSCVPGPNSLFSSQVSNQIETTSPSEPEKSRS